MFVAGLEFVSEVFVSGVEVEDRGEGKVNGAVGGGWVGEERNGSEVGGVRSEMG